jgi:hypothetical protein
MAMSDRSTLAPARGAHRSATPRAATRGLSASVRRWLLARLHAYARRQVALALGERVSELNQAIRTGAAARRELETQKEDAK